MTGFDSDRAMRRHVERAHRLRQAGADADTPPLPVDRQKAGRLTVAAVLGRPVG